MNDGFLVTTTTEGLQPLGTAAQRSYELVTGAVRDRLGADHAAIFAEPVAAQAGDRIDWYANPPARAVAADTLEIGARIALRERLDALMDDIAAMAAALGDSAQATDQRLAEALTNALQFPGDDQIWAVETSDGWRPVLVHWSWLGVGQQPVRGVLTRVLPAAASTTPAADTAAERRGSLWWLLLLFGWLLLAAMLAAILWLLIAPCGLDRTGPFFCPADPARLDAELTETRIAADEVARLERDIAFARRQCQPQPLEEAALPQDDIGERVTERGGALGQLNFVLQWQSGDDVDLHVTCPAGPTIGFRNRNDCNAALDVDANANRRRAVQNPVENVVFTQAPPGLYRVRVHLYSSRTRAALPVTLHVLRQDGPSQTYRGRVTPGQPEWITNINISR